MNKKQLPFLILLMSVSFISNANASSLPKSNIAEYHACVMNVGDDLRDLNKWIKKWNSWADTEINSGYTAYILTPMYGVVNTVDSIDFAWVGLAESRELFWKGKSAFINSGLQESFPAKCTSMTARQYAFDDPNDWQVDSNETPLVYRSCLLSEGRTIEDVYNIRQSQIDMIRAEGINSSMKMIIPGLGSPSEKYDFMTLINFGDMANMGKNNDIWNKDESMREKWRALNDNSYMCENSRMYVGSRIR
tara:strand:- start:588 stop:1331 length:744 start_codon:yes stop_codon:yes gene_type:complete